MGKNYWIIAMSLTFVLIGIRVVLDVPIWEIYMMAGCYALGAFVGSSSGE